VIFFKNKIHRTKSNILFCGKKKNSKKGGIMLPYYFVSIKYNLLYVIFGLLIYIYLLVYQFVIFLYLLSIYFIKYTHQVFINIIKN